MGDLLQKGSDWLQAKRHAHMSRPMTYRRDTATIALSATVGETVFEQVDDHGILQRTILRDCLLRAEYLVITGLGRITPQAGDVIEEADAGRPATVYEHVVVALGTEPAWRWSDPYRRTLRVHTRLAATRLDNPSPIP